MRRWTTWGQQRAPKLDLRDFEISQNLYTRLAEIQREVRAEILELSANPAELRANAERLEKDAKPDLSAIENPEELAKSWAAEIIGDERERLDRVQHFFKERQSDV